jgi:hypothetical protein
VRRLTPAGTTLAALAVAAAALVAIELGTGAVSEPAPRLADPCRSRQARGGGFDATVQRVVLDGLDGAACRLHTTREELVLSLGGDTGGRPRRWSRHTIELALRAGLLRSVDEAERRGDLPSFAARFLRRLVATAPLDTLVEGGIRLSDLLG